MGTRGVKSNWKWSSSVNSNNNHTSCYVQIKVYPSLLWLSRLLKEFLYLKVSMLHFSLILVDLMSWSVWIWLTFRSHWVSISYDSYGWALWKYILPFGDDPPKDPCAQQGFYLWSRRSTTTWSVNWVSGEWVAKVSAAKKLAAQNWGEKGTFSPGWCQLTEGSLCQSPPVK